ncbi:MAG: tetratricopeptide repeat protein [Syntrophobacteraceae bacterium]
MSKNKILTIYIFLTVATLIAFWQVTLCDFVNLDDPLYVTKNTHIMNGLTGKAIVWALTTTYANFWHPLTMASHMLDVQLFGLNPHGHHLTSLLFHIANTLLLFFILNRTTKAPWKSAFVAALFALHPLHVESVAWVAERKDVLSTFFWMLTMVAYIRYVDHPRLKSYLAVFALFILGMMAKPMLVTLPFVMLLMDYWPLKRFERKEALPETGAEPDEAVSANEKKALARATAKLAEHKHDWAVFRRLFIEKIPFFALIPIFSVLTYISEGEAVKHYASKVWIPNSLVSYVIYIEKMIWPTNLAVFYPHPGLWPLWEAAAAGLLLCAVTVTVIMQVKTFPYLAFGWLWFAGTLVPVIGIVQIGGFGRADRYTYIPMIGILIIVAWGIPDLIKKWRYRKYALLALSVMSIACCFIVTWTQVKYWRDSVTLFEHALKVTNNNYIAYRQRGTVYQTHGMYKEAIIDYNKAIDIYPEYARAYLNRGDTYAVIGNYDKAIADYEKAVEIDPEIAEAYYNKGTVYAIIGKQKQAIEDYDRAIEIDPGYAKAYINRGNAYVAIGNQKQAILDYGRAIEIVPKDAKAYYNRGIVYASIGNQKQAIEDYNRAIDIKPEFAEAYFGRSVSYSSLGDKKQSSEDLKTSAKLGCKAAQDLLKSRQINW